MSARPITMHNKAVRRGLVVSTSGRHCVIEEESGHRCICHPRGKKNTPIVGDWVEWHPSEDEGVIHAILPRKNLFYRQDALRTKTFAANIDLLLFFIAAEPEFSEWQLARALISAEKAAIPVHIVLNKSDLTLAHQRSLERLGPYVKMGYPVHCLSVHEARATGSTGELAALLSHKKTLVLGPSGSGKSSFINLLAPDAAQETREISLALQSGKHTTSATTLHWLERASDGSKMSALIDSPGFQEFGLHHIAPTELASLMPDLAAYQQGCRFYNCSHIHEPDCSLRAQVGSAVAPKRYEIYTDIWQELYQAQRRA